MSNTTAPKGAISLTVVDQAHMTYGAPNIRTHVVLPVVRIDEVRETMLGDFVVGQHHPVAIPGSVVIKVNGDKLYVAESPSTIRDLINSADEVPYGRADVRRHFDREE